MTFIGASTRLDGGWYRPHDIRLVPAAPADPADAADPDVAGDGGPAGTRGTATRVTPLITHTRVDVQVAGHAEPVVVHLPRGGDGSGVRPGQPVRLYPGRRPLLPAGAAH